MSDIVWQCRKYYGPDEGWTAWEDVTEGEICYTPHFAFKSFDSGVIEFRIKPGECGICEEQEAEGSGLCEYHLDVERGVYDDPWPDFHDDDGSGYWNTQEEWEPSR